MNRPLKGFVVVEREGLLKEGELERAREWAQRIAGGSGVPEGVR